MYEIDKDTILLLAVANKVIQIIEPLGVLETKIQL
jgi:hypothetical protein